MNIAWHYWCGTKNHIDMYVKYLLISVDSLIRVGNVNPKDIYATIEKSLMNNDYFKAIKVSGINILHAPSYRNYSKQICYYNLLQKNKNIDKLVQIDCDTIITDNNILEKISSLKGCVNIDYSADLNVYKTIVHRDGQKQKGNSILSISPLNTNTPHSGHPIKYACLKDLLLITYNVDLDYLLEKSKSEMLPIGFCYVFSPKELPEGFFGFLAFLNLFFEDDEVGISFAKFYFNLTYSNLNSDHTNINNNRNIIFNSKKMSCFNNFKGIVHFPNKDDLIDKDTTGLADAIVKRNLQKLL